MYKSLAFIILLIYLMFQAKFPQVTAQESDIKIVFTSERGSSDRQLYFMNLDGTDVQLLTDTRSAFHDRDVDSADCSPDGKHILFSSASGIHKINPDGTGLETIINGLAEYPDWSPDGSRFVFNWIKNNKNEIYTADSEGNDIVQVTENSRVDRFTTWSPDGMQFAFSAEMEETRHIFVTNVDATNEKQLTFNSNWEILPDWSPDGSKLLYTAYIKPEQNDESVSEFYYPDLFIVNSNGTNFKRLTGPNEGSNERGIWSPDGQQIAFTSSRDGNPEIYLMNSDGSEVKRLTNNDGSDYVECWLNNLPNPVAQHTATPLN